MNIHSADLELYGNVRIQRSEQTLKKKNFRCERDKKKSLNHMCTCCVMFANCQTQLVLWLAHRPVLSWEIGQLID